MERLPPGTTGIVTIDVGALAANWKALARLVAPAECAAVVKADAYGLGAAAVIPALFGAGCRTFFIATLEEARAARILAPNARLYVLNGLGADSADDLASLNASPVLASLAQVETWAALAVPPPCALHIDTGLNRLGLSPAEFTQLVARPDLRSRANIQLIMSHLACADEPAHPLNTTQCERFGAARQIMPAIAASLAASDGLMLGPDYHFDLTRPGYALYGGQAARSRPAPVSPVIRVQARVLQLRAIQPGDHVGYSATYTADKPRLIATLAAGYADGVPRSASATSDEKGGQVSYRACIAPIVGRVSMDLITVDATDLVPLGLTAGDWVDLVGPDLTLEDAAAGAGTIGYELLTRLGKRFHRVYIGGKA